ncbi:putative alpha amylase [Paracholeplasma brassicae]|uniref:Putative alpha amylase n=1 Tax=Acholeplasma brassicae TaxID=61635 RepID=U4KNA0_9MOLU|nr:alpha-glucosidase [Paracholeplasma brassicae]CCV65711.1 putative alpha amylase [Paracholeplasma brassicae]
MSFLEKKWWKEAVGYQIYIKSFNDSNGDGIGDINGIIEKLDYLKDLGVDLLWICPFYKSPMDDNGYDVSDYYQIAPEYGTLEDAKKMIDEAHKRGIKIIADFVMNQTSDEHPWFIESRKSVDNPYRDYYIWQKGKIVDGKEVEPTNWASFFGGSCWQKDELTNEYYMKIFSKKMPDLNWANPNVRKGMQDIATFWLDLGVDGFRVDAVAHIARSTTFEDSTMESNEVYKPDWRKFSNLPKLHDYLHEFNQNVLKHYDVMTVGEVGGGALPEEAIEYAGLDRDELNMVFNFDHNWCNNVWDLKDPNEPIVVNLKHMKEMFLKWQKNLYGKAWNPLYWLNHDQPRVMSQYGNEKKPFLSGSMLATALYFMWGTPFIYQGEEIGMTNYPFKTIDDFNDVSVKTTYALEKSRGNTDLDRFIGFTAKRSRDNARTPMQWNNKPYAGFSTKEPWFHVNPNFTKVNVEDQINDPNSLLNYYKKVIALKKDDAYKSTLVYGSYEMINQEHPQVYAYLRKGDQTILVVTNFFDCETSISLNGLKVKQVLLSNYESNEISLDNLILRPYESYVFEVSEGGSKHE